MTRNNRSVTYVFEQEQDHEYEELPHSPSWSSVPPSPSSSSDSGISWLLSVHDRIDNTETQTRELSNQSERQLGLIQAMVRTQTELSQQLTQQGEAMGGLMSRIEQNETSISQLLHATRTMFENQQESQLEFRRFRDQVTDRVEALQQQIRGTGLRESTRRQRQPSRNEQPSREETAAEPGITFTDVYGRRRRLCRYCGENFDASYCVKHETKEVCRRRRNNRN